MTGDGPTSLGLSERLERVLAYPLLWVSGLLLFLVERKNRNVQWHAKQSMAVFGPLSILYFLVGILGDLLGKIWVIGFLFSVGLGFLHLILFWVMVVLAIWLIVMAWFKPDYRLPFISSWLRY
ncbi:MAG TPA: hypothetical protein VFV38_38790 [Ktedonobacteraceae bacterium]|nr:hypothetical protein [Ktedonobacteraceae bacterium]